MSDKRIDPRGWAKINVETASSEIISGSGFPKEYQGESTGEYPFAKVGDISRVFRAKQKCISSAGHFISEKIRSEIKARVFPKGAIVFPKIGEALKGNYRVVTSREMLFDNNVMGIIPDTKLISGDFFYYFLTTQDFGRYAVATAVPSVRRGDIASISLLLPPLLEQHRIVAKIEELFSELDKGIENLKTVRAQLKVYRQALLKHAFEGKLTAQWRAENQGKLETAETLLKRIQQERAQRYQQQLADWQTHGGSKPKAPKPLPPLTAEELAELPKLPEGWGWVSFDALFEALSDGGLKIKQGDYLEGGILPVIDQGEKFIGGYLNDAGMKWVGELPVLLFGDHTRRFKLVHFPFALGADGVKVIGLSKICNPTYCYYIALTRRFEDRGYSRHFQFIKKALFPACSRQEQDQIVSEIESRFSTIDQLDQTITTSLQQSEALRQSILKKAFSGQLVPQDPHDEPASELLARIKAERATAEESSVVRKRSKRG